MADTNRVTHGMPRREEATIAALAQEMDTDEAVVESLYREEIAELEARSSVKNFIGVIAARRVKERLTAPRHRDAGRAAAPRAAKRSRVA